MSDSGDTDAVLPLAAELREIFEEVRQLTEGEVATYIPALGAANPDWFGASLVTVDGQRYDFGDVQQSFTIQSVSKPFAYGMALQLRGVEHVLQHVGVEPSGDPFNAIELDVATNRPHNPMVNAGAIMTTSLIGDHDALDAAFRRFTGRPLAIDHEVWESERETGDRNRAIAYLMRSFGMLSADVPTSLDAYFRQCAVLVNCGDLATMGATLANRGINPITGARALSESHVPRVLSVMTTCGMYDYAGEWLYRVGMPAKSGVSGGVLAVLPGQFGLGVFSPRLDEHGNSVRGIAFCEAVSQRFGLHLFSPPVADSSIVRRVYSGSEVRSKRQRSATEDAELQTRGSAVQIFELQGDVRFGGIEMLSRSIADHVGGTRIMILDLRRVGRLDPSVVRLFGATVASAEDAGIQLVVSSDGASVAEHLGVRRFESVDNALEWAEDRLLDADNYRHSAEPIQLSDVENLDGIDPAFVQALEARGELLKVAAGEQIFAEGDPADRVYFLLAGCVDIEFTAGGSRERRTSLYPGATFGDLAALGGGTRSAGVRAFMDSSVFELPIVELNRMGALHPDSLLTFYQNVARSLSRQLKRTSDELRALS